MKNFEKWAVEYFKRFAMSEEQIVCNHQWVNEPFPPFHFCNVCGIKRFGEDYERFKIAEDAWAAALLVDEEGE